MNTIGTTTDRSCILETVVCFTVKKFKSFLLSGRLFEVLKICCLPSLHCKILAGRASVNVLSVRAIINILSVRAIVNILSVGAIVNILSVRSAVKILCGCPTLADHVCVSRCKRAVYACAS